jgi:hypothetical protein
MARSMMKSKGMPGRFLGRGGQYGRLFAEQGAD